MEEFCSISFGPPVNSATSRRIDEFWNSWRCADPYRSKLVTRHRHADHGDVGSEFRWSQRLWSRRTDSRRLDRGDVRLSQSAVSIAPIIERRRGAEMAVLGSRARSYQVGSPDVWRGRCCSARTGTPYSGSRARTCSLELARTRAVDVGENERRIRFTTATSFASAGRTSESVDRYFCMSPAPWTACRRTARNAGRRPRPFASPVPVLRSGET